MVKAPSCHRLKHTEGTAMIELLYQHACYVKFRYRFSCTTGIAIHTTWNSDHLTAISKLS